MLFILEFWQITFGLRKLIKRVDLLILFIFVITLRNFLDIYRKRLSKKKQDHLYAYITSRLAGCAGLKVPWCQQLIKQTFESFSFNWAISSKRLISFILYSSVRTGGSKFLQQTLRKTYRIGLKNCLSYYKIEYLY